VSAAAMTIYCGSALTQLNVGFAHRP